MIFRIFFAAKARLDLQDASDYYNTKANGLGKRFLNAINNSMKSIETDPELFIVRYKTTRTAPVKKFPFLIHYSIDKRLNRIIILAILHTSRNPDNWPDE